MKALVYQGKEKIVVKQVPKPTIGTHDVLMQIKSVGICGTDLHIYRGGLNVPRGTIPGHEFSGIVAAVGQHVHNVKPGDRVVGEHVVTCKKCSFCKMGKATLCTNRQVIGLHQPGALAEFLSIPADLVFPFPKSIHFDEAALIEPLSIALYAVREAGFLLNKKVAVVGQGPIGLLLDQVLSAAGALVTGIDIRQNTLTFAKKMGWAHHTINTKTQNLAKRMRETKAIDGYNRVFEAVGSEATAAMSFAIARRDGDVFLLGIFDSPAKLDLMNIVKKELNVFGSWTCAYSFPESIELVWRKNVDLKSLITHTYPFDEGPRAFAEANSYSDERIKTIIKF
ncbi:alcohol dehydrogenase catalytic domain-containing protein [Patescibacteria group bacterium]|nr:alcohol dehydrogenase catalytic domain-containing protein [Patescibacteria group bacterium]